FEKGGQGGFAFSRMALKSNRKSKSPTSASRPFAPFVKGGNSKSRGGTTRDEPDRQCRIPPFEKGLRKQSCPITQLSS
ncbi:hypothetical protein AB4084_40990, partial [Lysobacter sp. 2RAB21]